MSAVLFLKVLFSSFFDQVVCLVLGFSCCGSAELATFRKWKNASLKSLLLETVSLDLVLQLFVSLLNVSLCSQNLKLQLHFCASYTPRPTLVSISPC